MKTELPVNESIKGRSRYSMGGGVLFLPIKATQWRMKSICLHSQNDFPVLNDSDVPHTSSFYSLYPIEYAH